MKPVAIVILDTQLLSARRIAKQLGEAPDLLVSAAVADPASAIERIALLHPDVAVVADALHTAQGETAEAAIMAASPATAIVLIGDEHIAGRGVVCRSDTAQLMDAIRASAPLD